MGNVFDSYSQKAFNAQLTKLVYQMSLGVLPALHPHAYLLGGQSGAGKTRLQKIIVEQRGADYIIINGDEYRKLHPHFAEIQDRYGVDAPAHTAAWSGAMVEALIDAFSMQGYNLIIEGTLRTSAVPLATASLLRERGYDVSLAIMAVKPEISLVSCQIRYELMRIAGTTPRAVDPDHHATIVKDIVGNLDTLDQSGLFDSIALFNRAGTCLLAADCPSGSPGASAVLSDVLFGDWTTEERSHYERLQVQLEELRQRA